MIKLDTGVTILHFAVYEAVEISSQVKLVFKKVNSISYNGLGTIWSELTNELYCD